MANDTDSSQSKRRHARVDEVAEALNIDRKSIYTALRAGEIKYVSIGRQKFIVDPKILDLLDAA